MGLKKAYQGALVGLAAAAALLALAETGLLDRWEFATWNWRAKFFARPTPSTEKIKLILLDQASLDWGKNENGLSWPWPREVYGPIVDFCRRGGAKAVAFDVLYTEPSLYGVSDDRSFAGSIKKSPPFVGALSLSKKTVGAGTWSADLPAHPLSIEGLDAYLSDPERAQALTYRWATFPIPEVAAGAARLGNVTEEPDPDSVFRRAALFSLFDGKAIPSLGFAAYLVAGSGAGLKLEDGSLRVGEKRVPLDSSGRAVLRFRGEASVYRAVSAAAVIQSELRLQAGEEPPLDPAFFRESYVLFGFSAPGLHDLRATPLSPAAPGVVVHATVLDNLLEGDFIRNAPRNLLLPVTLILAVLAAVGVVFCRKAWQSVLVFALFLPLPWLIGFGSYRLGLWWPIVASEGAVALALVGALVLNYATEGRQKAFIKQAFKFYLSPEVIERIIRDPDQLKLGGERRELTIFFSDLQGFSSLSERLDPQELTSLLNDYLTDMTDIILEEGGTLDKYEGDAIIAFWNAPLSQSDHAARACRAALRCQEKLAERRGEFQERSGELLKQRIGINTGYVVVGNMGSSERFDYTVLGDAANLASRLEGANKAFGTFLMVSETTWEGAKRGFVGRELGRIRVVGRKTPVRVYEPLGLAGEEEGPAREEFEKGLELCYTGEWSRALAVFEGLPDDPPARIYAARCRELVANPGEEWDGVWNLTEK